MRYSKEKHEKAYPWKLQELHLEEDSTSKPSENFNRGRDARITSSSNVPDILHTWTSGITTAGAIRCSVLCEGSVSYCERVAL